MNNLYIGIGNVYLSGWFNMAITDKIGVKCSVNIQQIDNFNDFLNKRKNINNSSNLIANEYRQDYNIPLPDDSLEQVIIDQIIENMSIFEMHSLFNQLDLKIIAGKEMKICLDKKAIEILEKRKIDIVNIITQYAFAFIKKEYFSDLIIYTFRKIPYCPPSYTYAFDNISIPDNWICLDVGCGQNPWLRADYFIDWNIEALKYIPDSKEFYNIDIEKDPLPFKDKSIDFLYCSHVLEHLNNPVKVAKEFSRVAKQGLIVVPSIFKEALFVFEESSHKWWILKKNDILWFIQVDSDFINKIKDVEVQKVMVRLYRLGSVLGRESKILRNYFFKTERYWDIIHYWKNELKIRIIGENND